jgi:hypothetical protein
VSWQDADRELHGTYDEALRERYKPPPKPPARGKYAQEYRDTIEAERLRRKRKRRP